MIHRNYTHIQSRVKRIYSVEGLTISSSGLSTSFLKTAGIALLVGNAIGGIICLIAGEFLYNPMRGGFGDINPAFIVVFIGGPIGLSYWLEFGKIAQVQVKTAIKKIIQSILAPRIDSDGKKFTLRKLSTKQEVV